MPLLDLTEQEIKLIKKNREFDALPTCDKCKGTGEIFSGYYGHPETSDGGRVMYHCSKCNGTGKMKFIKGKYDN